MRPFQFSSHEHVPFGDALNLIAEGADDVAVPFGQGCPAQQWSSPLTPGVRLHFPESPVPQPAVQDVCGQGADLGGGA